MAKKLLYHPESNSYIEVEEADLPALFASGDGALCVETNAVVVLTPQMPVQSVIAHDELVQRVTEREDALGAAAAITDQASMNVVRTLVKDTKKLYNLVDAERQRVLAPFKDAVDKINAAAKPLLTRLQDVMNEGKFQEGVYLIERDKKLADEERIRREAELLAMQDTSRPTAPLIAPTLAQPVEAPLNSVKEVKIVDEAKIPRHYYVLDRARLDADAKAGIIGIAQGVEVTTVGIITAR